MLMRLGDLPLIEHVVRRCTTSKRADIIAVITSTDLSDDPLYEFCLNKDIEVYRGPLVDVLGRYVEASNFFEIDLICRVCGDSPFVDVHQIDDLFDYAIRYDEYDYLSMRHSIDGFISEVFTATLLKQLSQQNLSNEDREHVTLYVRNHPGRFNMHFIDMEMSCLSKKISLTIDTLKDFQVCNRIANDLARAGKLDKFDYKTSHILEIIKELKKDK
jgi:spore coat polysaccharide biosynthesis protein SpsF (cytidylyltransferase family)